MKYSLKKIKDCLYLSKTREKKEIKKNSKIYKE